MDREPEPWQVTHAAPFLMVEGSDVAVWALGGERFRVEHPDGSGEVEGFERARQISHELAGEALGC
jgi:hypothetical protein